MPNMGKTIDAFVDEGLRDKVKIMLGGAPVTQEFAEDMGADGYGKDAMVGGHSRQGSDRCRSKGLAASRSTLLPGSSGSIAISEMFGSMIEP